MFLTTRQATVEQFVREYHETRGYSPSVRDVAAWLGISAMGAMGHLRALKRKGRILWDQHTPRSIRLVYTCKSHGKTETVVS